MKYCSSKCCNSFTAQNQGSLPVIFKGSTIRFQGVCSLSKRKKLLKHQISECHNICLWNPAFLCPKYLREAGLSTLLRILDLIIITSQNIEESRASFQALANFVVKFAFFTKLLRLYFFEIRTHQRG